MVIELFILSTYMFITRIMQYFSCEKSSIYLVNSYDKPVWRANFDSKGARDCEIL